MNTIKKTILGLGILTAGLASAQSSEMTNMLKVGINAGVAVPSNNASANVGFDIAYQHLITPGFGIGIASGYNHFFGKDNTVNGVTIKNNDFAVVPVAAMLRYYPQKTGFYLGTDLGYGFITGDDNVAEGSIVKRPDGGFYLKPEIGYHNRNWNFAVQYTKVFTGDKGNIAGQDYSVGSIGAGISYNFPLGK
jgi:hypothetical protein